MNASDFTPFSHSLCFAAVVCGTDWDRFPVDLQHVHKALESQTPFERWSREFLEFFDPGEDYVCTGDTVFVTLFTARNAVLRAGSPTGRALSIYFQTLEKANRAVLPITSLALN